jgi:hypothetical protein
MEIYACSRAPLRFQFESRGKRARGAPAADITDRRQGRRLRRYPCRRLRCPEFRVHPGYRESQVCRVIQGIRAC